MDIEPTAASPMSGKSAPWRQTAKECLLRLTKRAKDIGYGGLKLPLTSMYTTSKTYPHPMTITAASLMFGAGSQILSGIGNPTNNPGEWLTDSLCLMASLSTVNALTASYSPDSLIFSVGNKDRKKLASFITTSCATGLVSFVAACILNAAITPDLRNFTAGDDIQIKTITIDKPWSNFRKTVTRQGETLTLTINDDSPDKTTLNCVRIYTSEQIISKDEVQKPASLDVDTNGKPHHEAGDCALIKKLSHDLGLKPTRVLGRKASHGALKQRTM